MAQGGDITNQNGTGGRSIYGESSQMSKCGIHIPIRVFCLWQTLALIPMVHNSSFALEQPHILMRSIPFSEESSTITNSLSTSKPIHQAHKISLLNRLQSLTAENSKMTPNSRLTHVISSSTTPAKMSP